jgi:hypothetical protein
MLFLLVTLNVSAQVNAYAEVTAIAGSTLTIGTVNETFDSFEVGDFIVIMQMQDDVLGTTTNSAAFGDVGDIASAGLFEIEEIASITEAGGVPTSISLQSAPDSTYNTGANSSLQIISFPTLGSPNYTTTADITAVDWNGTIGGVVAFEVNGTLTLEHDISADAAGFRGGDRSVNESGAICTAANSGRYREDNDELGFKGEGIYRNTNNTYNNARGRLANGGGGGSHHNGGGAGGGNYVTGGIGGNGWNNCTANPAGGIGGVSLASHISGNRVFMGGGGGGGQQNNTQSRAGGDGGGIVLIKATTITTGTCAGVSISANGVGPATSGTNDGGGGGGAGGSIVFDVQTWSITAGCPVTIESSGGDGSSSLSGGSHAGGGGGSQGVVIYNLAQPTSNVTTSISNGAPGCGNTSNPCNSLAGAPSGSGNDGIISNTSNVLPVELRFFHAQPSEHDVVLMWETATETNNDFFVIERSTDGHEWKRLGKVQGAGTSNRPNTYSLTDWTPEMGMNIYRLHQVDFDGMKEYFEPAYAEFGAHEIRLFPNPSDDRLVLSGFDSVDDISVIVYDMMGKPLHLPIMKEEVEIRIETSMLPAGPYYLVYQIGQQSEGIKFTVQH